MSNIFSKFDQIKTFLYDEGAFPIEKNSTICLDSDFYDFWNFLGTNSCRK